MKTRLRLLLERFVSKYFRSGVAEYFVQTPTMQKAVEHWYKAAGGGAASIRVFPFAAPKYEFSDPDGTGKKWDFVYVSDGEAHKNHRNLFEAWRLLAQQGLRPSLVLTLSLRDTDLKQDLKRAMGRDNLDITDLGKLSHAEVIKTYARSRALVFPSTSESFGLPLV